MLTAAHLLLTEGTAVLPVRLSSARRALTVLCLLALPAGLRAQGLDYVKAHYTKFEYRIPMRDGVKLFTAVYVPKDDSRTYPILMMRTPYNVEPYGADRYKKDLGPSPLAAKAGYIFVYQDVRGRFQSEGEYVNMRPHDPKKGLKEIDESSDTWDTVDWLLKNVRGHNGKAGQWGISYPGFYTAAAMVDAHPAMKACSPQAPITDWFVGDDFHHNGAFLLPHLFNFISVFGKPRPQPTTKWGPRFEHGTPDGYDFFLRLGPLPNADAKYFKGDLAFWEDVMKHGTYDDFWKARNLRQHMKNVRPAVLTVGGWFDAENLFGALETFKKTDAYYHGPANHLVMGPWFHGGWSRSEGESLGNVHFNAKTSEYYREKLELPFFEQHLKGEAPKDGAKLAKAMVFETGTNRWRHYDAWPPAGTTKKALSFRAGGKLAFDGPSEEAGSDEFVSDPAKPVPYYDKIAIGMEREYMTADQRFAAQRPDVLAYETDVLAEDVTVAGPVGAELVVSTTGTDADWVVKLIDVYPDDLPDPDPNPTGVKLGGYQQLVRGDVMRGKFRDSYEDPQPFKPGEPTPVRFALPDVCHTFRSGHRIMVQVQSSWFPLVDRNPQTFEDIYSAKAEDFHKATHRVYRGKEGSRVVLNVVE
jgi:putative CocE/NonD family hydrolase